MGRAIGPKRSGGRHRRRNLFRDAKAGFPAGRNFFVCPVARSKRGCAAAGLRSDPPITDTRGIAPASRDSWSNNMATEAGRPAKDRTLRMHSPPTLRHRQSLKWKKEARAANQATRRHGNENTSLSHDPARHRQIQLREPIHTSHPCPAAPNQARYSQTAFALFWANSHRQQASTLTGKNIPTDLNRRARFVGFRGLSVERVRFSLTCTSEMAVALGYLPTGCPAAQTHAH